jgi:hypothetical protein
MQYSGGEHQYSALMKCFDHQPVSHPKIEYHAIHSRKCQQSNAHGAVALKCQQMRILPMLIIVQLLGHGLTAQDKPQTISIGSMPRIVIESNRDWLSLGINIVLAIVGVGATIAAFWTLSVIRRQTTAIETQTESVRRSAEAAAVSALAAEVSAKALQNSERGWLILQWNKATPNGGQHNSLSYSFKNGGRTPVWITRVAARYEKTDQSAIEPISISSAKPLRITEAVESEKSSGSRSAGTFWLEPIDLAGVHNGHSFIHFHGIVVYRDIFQAEHTNDVLLHLLATSES